MEKQFLVLLDGDLVVQIILKDWHLSNHMGYFLEGEHGNVDPANLSNYTRACDIIGATPIVRINQNDQGVIYRTLDLGALGIVVPHVNNKEEAENVVEGGKFYPFRKKRLFHK